MAFSIVERILFLLVGATSLYLFWMRFGRVWNKIVASKKDPGFTLHPIAKRSWDFFSEVICQSKVIKERPLPGLAHAFVFWGFCAFGLITLNHIATLLAFPFLQRGGFVSNFYFGMAAAFGICVAVSIVGLAIRRFLVRPKWLGSKLSYESGFISLLIFMLMITY